jgi:hypothetical protein
MKIVPAPESERKRSPLGAVRMRRGMVNVPPVRVITSLLSAHSRGDRIAAIIKGDFKASRGNEPHIGRPRNHMRRIVDGFPGLWVREIGNGDLASDPGAAAEKLC